MGFVSRQGRVNDIFYCIVTVQVEAMATSNAPRFWMSPPLFSQCRASYPLRTGFCRLVLRSSGVGGRTPTGGGLVTGLVIHLGRGCGVSFEFQASEKKAFETVVLDTAACYGRASLDSGPGLSGFSGCQ